MEREELELKTPDGRRLRAQLAGPADGELVVVHTGTPDSRHLYEETIAEGARRGLRHVCCSRPGYEGSDRRPGRSFGDCAGDVASVVDALGIDRFYVVGSSTGGACALACAALLGERVIAAAAISSFAPRRASGLDWSFGMGRWNREEFAALESGEAELIRFISDSLRGYLQIEHGSQLIDSLDGSLCEADLAACSGDFLEFQVASCARIGRGAIWGWFDDDWAIWGDWGFDPARIGAPVSIWHGGEDRIVPAAHGEWLAATVPGARFHLMPGDGHFSIWARRYGAVLDELLSLDRK